MCVVFSIISHNRALAYAKHAKNEAKWTVFTLFSYATWQIWSKAWQCTPWSITFSLLCRRIVQSLSSYYLSPVVVLSKPFLVLSNLSRPILYLFVLRQKHPSSNKTLPDSSRFSNLFAIFATSFRYYSGGTEWLYRKGVIEIIFISLKFSQSLNMVRRWWQ